KFASAEARPLRMAAPTRANSVEAAIRRQEHSNGETNGKILQRRLAHRGRSIYSRRDQTRRAAAGGRAVPGVYRSSLVDSPRLREGLRRLRVHRVDIR